MGILIKKAQHLGEKTEFKKGFPPWNKGKKLSHDHRTNISKAKKGSVPWIRGKQHTDETKKKMRDAKIGFKPVHKQNWRYPPVSAETRQRRSELFKGGNNPNYGRFGEDHPSWKGGLSFEPYCSKFNNRLKERIRERDNRTCQLCDIKENGKKLHVHHIHYDKTNCNPDLIALCTSCNSKVNFNRDYYEALFMQKLKDREMI